MRGAIAVLLALLAIWPLQESIDRNRPKRPSALLYTPDRRLMKVVSFGHGTTLADLTWVQSTGYVIQEFQQGKTHIEHLHALYDVLTELDPNFVDAYVAGATFLSSLAQEPERALELLEKGQGRLRDLGDRVEEDPDFPGRVHPRHLERWRLLQEIAATHLVSYAGFATTPEERQDEIRLSGRMLVFGAKRYPLDLYPSRPPWFEQLGGNLARRRVDIRNERGWREAVEFVWRHRELAAPEGSPLKRLAERRLAELASRGNVELIERAVERYRRDHVLRDGFDVAPPNLAILQRPWGDLPDLVDPLGVGYWVEDGRVMAPGLDAALVERELTRRVHEFHRTTGRFPASLDELRASYAGTKVQLIDPPSWVQVHYEPATGELRAKGVPPRLVEAPERR